MKKSVTILELRQLVRSVIQEIASDNTERAPDTHAMAQARTEPVSGMRKTMQPGVQSSEQELQKANLRVNPNSQKAAQVVKVLASRGEILAPEAIQSWLKTRDPSDTLVKTAEQLADDYSQGSPAPAPAVGTPKFGQGDFDQEQKAKAKQAALFDKYSTPKENFK